MKLRIENKGGKELPLAGKSSCSADDALNGDTCACTAATGPEMTSDGALNRMGFRQRELEKERVEFAEGRQRRCLCVSGSGGAAFCWREKEEGIR